MAEATNSFAVFALLAFNYEYTAGVGIKTMKEEVTYIANFTTSCILVSCKNDCNGPPMNLSLSAKRDNETSALDLLTSLIFAMAQASSIFLIPCPNLPKIQ